jgi:hypothetical protein
MFRHMADHQQFSINDQLFHDFRVERPPSPRPSSREQTARDSLQNARLGGNSSHSNGISFHFAMPTFFGSVKKPAFASRLRLTSACQGLRHGRRSASQHDLFRYANVLGHREKSQYPMPAFAAHAACFHVAGRDQIPNAILSVLPAASFTTTSWPPSLPRSCSLAFKSSMP